MPISEDEFREPKWIKLRERYPMSYDSTDRFNEVNPRHPANRYPGDEGREGGWKQAGYNPNHNSITIERIQVRSDSIQLKPY
jgi:hypothetical protein